MKPTIRHKSQQADAIASLVEVVTASPIPVVHAERHDANFHALEPQALADAEGEPLPPRKPRVDLRTNSSFPFTGDGLRGAPAPAGRIRPVDFADPQQVEAVLARGWRRVW